MRVIIAGGGTGGHLYPGLAIFERLRDRGTEVIFLVSQKGIESQLLEKEGIRFERLDLCGWQRRLFSLQTIEFIWKTLTSVIKEIKHLQGVKPDVVVGMGGYVCLPAVVAAWCLRIPCLLHEQNVIPGRANRLLVRLADKIAVSFPQSLSYLPADKVVVTGNPLRQIIGQVTRQEGRDSFGLKADSFTLLVFGGSRGASQINEAMLVALSYINKQMPDVEMIWVTGEKDYEKVKELTKGFGISIRLFPYLFEMAKAYAASDLVVCRAGATTLAEIIVYQLPAILIPYPYATDNHQSANAKVMEEAGCAKVLKDVSGCGLAGLILSLSRDRTKLKMMADRCQGLAAPDAASRLIEIIDSLVKQVRLVGHLGGIYV